ncbi:MAG: 50S ribosomal protein L4 [Clostridia bacterium]|nr:50S ribosomal protein L4 [Clostridia bacterium]
MPKAALYNVNGEALGEIELPESVFGQPVNRALMKQAVEVYAANQRQGTHATRTRGMVSGGGRKPWRQKHTGRARQGSIRAPHWRHGGVVFGPHPRDYRLSIPKKMRRRALASALSARASDGGVVVVEGLGFDKPQTKQLVRLLEKLPHVGHRTLVVTASHDPNVYLSGRNVEGVTVRAAADLNTYEVLQHSDLVIAKDALARMEEVLAR